MCEYLLVSFGWFNGGGGERREEIGGMGRGVGEKVVLWDGNE